MRSKGLNIRVPRLGVNRHGVFYVRSSAQDASGRRRVTQRSLGTKDPLLAKVLALRMALNRQPKEFRSALLSLHGQCFDRCQFIARQPNARLGIEVFSRSADDSSGAFLSLLGRRDLAFSLRR